MTRSALIAPQTLQDVRRRLMTRKQWQRAGQAIEVALARDELAARSQPRGGSVIWQWSEDRDRASTIRDLYRLPGLDTTEQLACSLSEFAYARCRHVLVVAH